MKKVWRQPLFVTGFTIIFLLLAGSFVYEWVFGNDPKQTQWIEENGRPVESWPISPRFESPVHIFGTDQLGYDLFTKIIIGAKYTILSAMAIAALRMIIAVPIGFFIGTTLRKYRPVINSLIDPIHYMPITIFAFFILYPILWMPMEGFTTTLTERIVLEIVILSLLTAPIVIALVANESSLLYKQEYIMASKTLGARNGRIIVKHLLPQMREKLFVLYGQQLVETLVLFTHLGMLQLFLGGTKVSYGLMADPPMSISYEWAGLFGDTFRYLGGAPWLPLTPAIFFAILIFAVSAMMEGFTRATNDLVKVKRRKGVTSMSEEIVEWNREQLREKMTLLKSGQR